jgi:hypothetical protein
MILCRYGRFSIVSLRACPRPFTRATRRARHFYNS